MSHIGANEGAQCTDFKETNKLRFLIRLRIMDIKSFEFMIPISDLIYSLIIIDHLHCFQRTETKAPKIKSSIISFLAIFLFLLIKRRRVNLHVCINKLHLIRGKGFYLFQFAKTLSYFILSKKKPYLLSLKLWVNFLPPFIKTVFEKFHDKISVPFREKYVYRSINKISAEF